MSQEPTLPKDALALSITNYVACSKCADEVAKLDPPESLQNYAAMDVGFTDWGVQVWCRRHKVNIVHIDFEGQKLPADFRRLEIV
ncbi:MAG: hypothetical protein HN835_04740 [Rhodobiaceae bacterium]|jgi:hypothetical protein|nr:hypothetical protein [Rhodobiaceae bacterium]MDG2496452.1 hypothetical protein [Alphaproteobacteria bacterium]